MEILAAKNLDAGIRSAKTCSPNPVLANLSFFRLSLARSFMNQRFLLNAVIGIFALVVTHSALGASLAGDQSLKLPSGHVAKILSVSRIEYAKGVVALMVRYQTSLSMEETKAVSDEADEVWKVAQKEVERIGLAEAIISPSHTEKGLLLTTSREANFIFEKGADGKWTRLSRGDAMASE